METTEHNKGTDLTPLLRALALMAEQHGLASDTQVRHCDVSLKPQQRLINEGVWTRYAPGVVADGATADPWHRRAMAATLAPGATSVLTGAAAARLHFLDGFADIERIIVVVPVGRRVRVAKGVTVWRSRLLIDEDVTTIDGIRATTIAAMLVVLARYRHEGTIKALDSALRRGSKPADLRAVFERWKGFGVEGPPATLRLLHERAEARLPRSWFQRLAGALLVDHGINMVDEWPVCTDRGASGWPNWISPTSN